MNESTHASARSSDGSHSPRISRYSADLLWRLRNEIPIESLIRHWNWPHKRREGRFVFLCPHCSEFLTGVKADTNLARCFHCEVNFNPIDFTMQVVPCDFVQAVERLLPMLKND